MFQRVIQTTNLIYVHASNNIEDSSLPSSTGKSEHRENKVKIALADVGLLLNNMEWVVLLRGVKGSEKILKDIKEVKKPDLPTSIEIAEIQ